MTYAIITQVISYDSTVGSMTKKVDQSCSTFNLSSSSNSISVKVSETLFNQFLAITESTNPENVSQHNSLASLINLDNLIVPFI